MRFGGEERDARKKVDRMQAAGGGAVLRSPQRGRREDDSQFDGNQSGALF